MLVNTPNQFVQQQQTPGIGSFTPPGGRRPITASTTQQVPLAFPSSTRLYYIYVMLKQEYQLLYLILILNYLLFSIPPRGKGKCLTIIMIRKIITIVVKYLILSECNASNKLCFKVRGGKKGKY